MKKWNSPYLLLILATCIWGGNFVAGKALVTVIPPITLAALRWTVAFVVLLPFLGKQVWANRENYLRSWKLLLFLSLTGVAGFNTLTYMAVQYTGSINASLMNAATPIMVVILSWMIMKDRIVWGALPGILISMAGVAWIISRGSLGILLSFQFNRGDLIMLTAILCWALYSVGMKRAAGRMAPSPMLLAQVAVALIVLLPMSALEILTVGIHAQWTSGLAAGVLYIGLFASIIAFLSWNKAIELAGPQKCAGFLNLIPLFSAVFATFFAGEFIEIYHAAGAVLIVVGVYAATRFQKSHKTLSHQAN